MTRTGLEPMLPAWKAGVLTNLTNGSSFEQKQSYHRDGQVGNYLF